MEGEVVSTVEVRLIGGDLSTAMGNMRTWLDHRKIVPQGFRQSVCPGGLAFHVDFDGHPEADEFAASFGGRVLGAFPKYSEGLSRNG